MHKNKIYVAGPMTGLIDYNFPKFFEISEKLMSFGWNVVNPAQIANNFGGQDAFLNDKNVETQVLAEQARQLKDCNAILLLDGWTKSKGSKIELQIALENGIDVFVEKELLG